MTQTPASGPFAPVTTPPMWAVSIWTAACCALAGAGSAILVAAIPTAPTVDNKTCRKLILPSLQCLGLSWPCCAMIYQIALRCVVLEWHPHGGAGFRAKLLRARRKRPRRRATEQGDELASFQLIE